MTARQGNEPPSHVGGYLPAAFIFDMDDLLVRSAHIWRAAEEALLAELGYPWNEDIAGQYKGMNTLDVAATIHRILQPALPLPECQRILRDALIAGYQERIEEMPGAVGLVRRLQGQAPLAVASGSPLPVIERAMDVLKIRDAFALLLSSESVRRGKPHPDIYLATAEQLRVKPADCLVFEDSFIGVCAAKAAGMKCFAVPSLSGTEIPSIADRVFDSLADVVV